MFKKWIYSCLIWLGVGLTGFGQVSETFTNPLLPTGADPFSFYKDGFYYYMHTMGNKLVLWKTPNLAQLSQSEKITIFDPPPNLPYSKGIWAPEIHFIDGAWYVYFAADDGQNKNHRMYVLENRSGNPMNQEWKLKGKLADKSDKWAIDGNLFKYNKQLYFIWSGWEGEENGRQNIYIASMSNPYTISSERVLISTPEYPWELFGTLKNPVDPPHVAVNEGPQSLFNGKKCFIVYSASGCWTDHYTLGLLQLTGKNPLDPTAWKKHPEPVFKSDPENGVYATGHNSFFTSPNGKENWILYHANDLPGQGCGKYRSPRAQQFRWNKDGTPDFGKPIKPGLPIPLPK